MGCRKGVNQGMWLALPGTLGTLGVPGKRSVMQSKYFMSSKRVPGAGKRSKLGLNLEGVLQVLPGKPEILFRFLL